MRLIFSLISILFLSINLFGQKLYFPTVGDGSQSPKAEFGYLEFVPLEVHTDSIVSLVSTNGRIERVDHYFYNYGVYPVKTGSLRVSLVSLTDGLLDTTISEIIIVKRPEIRLVAHEKNDSIKLNFLDKNGVIVTDEFYCAMEGIIEVNGDKYNVFYGNWKKWIDYKSDFNLNRLSNRDDLIISFKTTAVYSEKYDLFSGNYACSIKIN